MSSTEEMAKKFATEKRTFFKGLVPIIISVVVAILLAAFAGIVGGIIGIIIVPIIAFIVLYFVWAPNDVFGTFPEEGYATVIVRGLGFRKLFLKKKGFGFNNNWDVVPIEYATVRPREFLGMFLFLWPFERLYVYKQKWVKYTEKEKPVEKEEVLRGALLKTYVYFIGLSGAEDLINMPIDIGMAVEMVIVNPYKALFQMQNWYRGISNFIQGEIRNEVRKQNYSELIAKGERSLDYILIEKLETLVSLVKDQYGVEISKIKIVQISPADKELVKASTRMAVAEFEKKAIKVEAEAQSYKRSTETMGPIIDMLVSRTGLTLEQIQQETRNNPREFSEKYSQIIQEGIELVKTQIAGDKSKYIKIDTSGNNGEGGNPLLDLIATFMAMSEKSKEPTKELSEGTKKESKESSRGEDKKNKSSQEKADEILKKYESQ
ncbi:MAG: hypothetical protein MCSN_5370 [Candidatus Microsyncoccus archaeolyticus]|nr:MAG: hypothetical protein MCSN_5370 [Candidatus Parcubacteria bacterium]